MLSMYCSYKSCPIGTRLSIKRSSLAGILILFKICWRVCFISVSFNANTRITLNRSGADFCIAFDTTAEKFACPVTYPSMRKRCFTAAGICTASARAPFTIKACVVVSLMTFLRYGSILSPPPAFTAQYSNFPPATGFLNRTFFWISPFAIAIAFPFCQSVPANARSVFWSFGIRSSFPVTRMEIACKSKIVFNTRSSSGSSFPERSIS